MLNVNDVCFLALDWAEDDIRGKRVQVLGTQTHGQQTFYRVLWRCRDAYAMKEKYGNLFSECELKKIEK